jgi:tripartite-type tricarboxylate transporter receptor subunit TctC
MKRAVLAVFTSVFLTQAPAADGDYPSQPIRIVVGFTAGSTTDILARAVAAKLQEAWGKPAVVENRPGAAGIVAGQALLGAPADGHTLMVVSAGHAVSAALYSQKLPYDTVRDFSGVTLLATVPSILVVPMDSNITSVKELLAEVRAKPGKYNYSTPGIGSANHLAGAYFTSLAKLQVQQVAYKGIPQALQAAMTGEALYNFSPVVNVLPAAKGGKVRALAASTTRRSSAMPDLPTVAEAGLTGYAFDPWFGLLTSAKTPPPVVAKLNAEVTRMLGLPDVAKQLMALGAEPSPMKPEAFDSLVREEIQKFATIIRDANIKVE